MKQSSWTRGASAILICGVLAALAFGGCGKDDLGPAQSTKVSIPPTRVPDSIWAAIDSHVPDSTLIIEYTRFNKRQPLSDSITPWYIALVITESGQWWSVDLGPAMVLDGLIARYRENLDSVQAVKSYPGSRQTLEYRILAESLYAALLSPMSTEVNSAQLLLVAPDGPINLVSFAGLVVPGGDYLVTKCPIHYLGAAREFMSKESEYPRGRGLLAMGSPDYSGLVRGSSNSVSRSDSSQLSGQSRALLSRVPTDSLVHARSECISVCSLWAATTGEPCTLELGSNATESNLKSLATGKRVLHLATHGYFLPALSRAGVTTNSLTPLNPFLLSGLVLSVLKPSRLGLKLEDSDDGVLTAYEVTDLDLRGVELVVLSACESGIGSIADGEGVDGLRRAFLLAGARTVVSALWKVPDSSTSVIMTGVYSSLGAPIYERLQKSQIEQVLSLRKRRLSDHPFSWGGFVSTGSDLLPRTPSTSMGGSSGQSAISNKFSGDVK